jgi:hypothetical protein
LPFFFLDHATFTFDSEWSFAYEANDFLVALSLLDEHVFPAFRIGTLNGEDHGVISQANY